MKKSTLSLGVVLLFSCVAQAQHGSVIGQLRDLEDAVLRFETAGSEADVIRLRKQVQEIAQIVRPDLVQEQWIRRYNLTIRDAVLTMAKNVKMGGAVKDVRLIDFKTAAKMLQPHPKYAKDVYAQLGTLALQVKGYQDRFLLAYTALLSGAKVAEEFFDKLDTLPQKRLSNWCKGKLVQILQQTIVVQDVGRWYNVKGKAWAGGPQVSPNALKGKVVVLEFWATWCGPCVRNIPHMNQLYKKFGGKMEVIAVTDRARTSRDDHIHAKIEYPVAILNPKSPLFRFYGNRGIPFAVVFDQRGIRQWSGHPSSPAMERMIQQLIK